MMMMAKDTSAPLGLDFAGGGAAPAAGKDARRVRRVRRAAGLAVIAQLAFVASWLAAVAWQGPRYSAVTDSISDMYALTAPHAAFLIVVITACGAATMWFAWSLRAALRPAGWVATAGAALLALSIFGLGDLLTAWEREACRLADPGCTAASQLANSGGSLDATLSTAGLVAFIVAGFFLAAAMKRVAGWARWAWPARWAMVAMIAGLALDGLGQAHGFAGLAERAIAVGGAAGIAVLAGGVRRRHRLAG